MNLKFVTEGIEKFKARDFDHQNVFINYWRCFLVYGVFTKKEFSALDVMLEYKGELVSSEEASRRHLQYATEKKGCSIYEIIYDDTKKR